MGTESRGGQGPGATSSRTNNTDDTCEARNERAFAIGIAILTRLRPGEQIWADKLADRMGVVAPCDNRTFQQIFRRAHKDGLLTRTDRAVSSTRRSRHSGDQRVWVRADEQVGAVS